MKINALNQRAACLSIAKVSAANKGIKKTVFGYLGVLCKCLCKTAYLIYSTVISFIGFIVISVRKLKISCLLPLLWKAVWALLFEICRYLLFNIDNCFFWYLYFIFIFWCIFITSAALHTCPLYPSFIPDFLLLLESFSCYSSDPFPLTWSDAISFFLSFLCYHSISYLLSFCFP